MTTSRCEIVDETIKSRRTLKVLPETPFPTRDVRSEVEALIEVAGMAPFHRPAHESHRTDGKLNSIVPWRFYLWDAEKCRSLRAQLDREKTGKIYHMLAAADAAIAVTWLPNPAQGSVEGLFEATLENMEHLAAASAAVQNLLISATAHGWENYWSSGGVFRSEELCQQFSIPSVEILLGTVFLFPAETGEAQTVPGSLRNKRGLISDWSRWV